MHTNQRPVESEYRLFSLVVESEGVDTFTSWSAVSGTASSRIWTGTKVSMICSMVCRYTRSCGRRSSSGARRSPLSSDTAVVVVESVVPRAGLLGVGASGTSPCTSARTLLPGPGHPLSPWGCVVRELGQGHSDRLPLVPQGSAQSSPSSPLCGSRGAFDIHHFDR